MCTCESPDPINLKNPQDITHVKKPCKECPFMATSKPGALGGSPPETYIGQAFAPFILPCHMHCDFSDPQWREKSGNTPQCAGAAMFRKAMGLDSYLPKEIYTLQPEGEVLRTPVEFYAHHKQITKQEAALQLLERPIHQLIREQLSKSSVIRFNFPEPKTPQKPTPKKENPYA